MKALNLVKLCVGAEAIDDLIARIEHRVRVNEAAGIGRVHDHVTRMHPRRESELLAGGSIYWVIKGVILARQPIVGFNKQTGTDDIRRTAIMLDPGYVLTEAQPRRAFQGWRYLTAEDAPADLKKGKGRKGPPPELGRKLAELGLL
ncbi:DUF1489 family protein [Hyphococcus lacteus]|uniref:DUF1489 domain-containing protein n=1 Tax=Hyphococcus lacteus TaxID=3143536 RepID=A0ABV3Z3C0_9PROT